MDELSANSGDSDQTLHSDMSDLGLHCLPVTSLAVSSPQWVVTRLVKFPLYKEKVRTKNKSHR